MNLVIDFGNSYIKIAVFKGDTLVFYQRNLMLEPSIIFELKQKFEIKRAIISSVRENDSEISKLFSEFNISFIWLSTLLKFPFQIMYKTPKTLGLDRLAAVTGAYIIFSKSNVLVIDLGSCLTFDLIDENATYFGGSIAPGFEMRFKALQHFTQKLPLIKYANNKINLIGDSTENSILSGVYNGMKKEIEGIIYAYQQQYKNLKIVLTGGDFKLFDLEPKNRIFADEFLVLKGLNKILIDNEQI